MKAASAADCIFRFAKAPAMFAFKKQVYSAAGRPDGRRDRRARLTFAESAGIPRADFLNCYLRDESLADVRKDLDEGQRLGVKSTPTYFIDGTEITWIEDKVMEDFLRSKDPSLKSIEYPRFRSDRAGRTGRGHPEGVRPRDRAPRVLRLERDRDRDPRPTGTPSLTAGWKVHSLTARTAASVRPARPSRTTGDLPGQPLLRDEHAEQDDAADARLEGERRVGGLDDPGDAGRRVHVVELDEGPCARSRRGVAGVSTIGASVGSAGTTRSGHGRRGAGAPSGYGRRRRLFDGSDGGRGRRRRRRELGRTLGRGASAEFRASGPRSPGAARPPRGSRRPSSCSSDPPASPRARAGAVGVGSREHDRGGGSTARAARACARGSSTPPTIAPPRRCRRRRRSDRGAR